jgi:hypothetical protein
MLRNLVGAALVVAVCVGVAAAEDKGDKKAANTTGVVKKIDADKGLVTLTVKVKKESVDKEFKIDDATKFAVVVGDEKKDLPSKDALKNEALKEGATIVVTVDADGKVTGLQIGVLKKPGVSGVLKKVDADKGVLTVTVKEKKEMVDKEFTINDATKFVVGGKDKKELLGKDGLKSDTLKEGANLTVVADKDGKVKSVTVAEPKKPKNG